MLALTNCILIFFFWLYLPFFVFFLKYLHRLTSLIVKNNNYSITIVEQKNDSKTRDRIQIFGSLTVELTCIFG